MKQEIKLDKNDIYRALYDYLLSKGFDCDKVVIHTQGDQVTGATGVIEK